MERSETTMPKKVARLDLDFSPSRRNRPAGWLLLAVGLAAATLAAVQFQSAEAARTALASELDSASGRLSGSSGAASRAGPPLDPRVSKAANQVARELQMPWAEMLAALEAIPAPEVALLGVEPSALRHVVRITAEAKNPGVMLDYLQALQSGRQFSDVWLTSHQMQVLTPGQPVRFVVQLKWNGQS